MLSTRWRTIISCSVVLVPPGGIAYGFTSLLPYLLSRLRYVDPSSVVTATDLSWLYALLVAGQSISMILGGVLERWASTRVIALCSALLFNFVIMSMYWACNDFTTLCLSYFFVGCLIGVLYITALVVGLSWADEEKGLVSGILCLGFGLSSVIVSPLQSLYINHDNVPAQNISGQYIFNQDDLMSRVPIMFLIFALFSFILQTPLTYLMTKRIEDKIDIKDTMDTSHMLKTKEFYILFVIFMLNKSPLLYVATYAKVFSETFQSNDRLLSVIIGLGGVFNALGRPFWGYITDRFTLQISLFLVCVLTSFSTFITYLSKFIHTALFAIGVWSSYFCCCGNYAIFPTATVYYFGQGGTKYGTLYLSQAFGALLSALIDGLVPQWWPMVVTVGSISLVSAVLTFGLSYEASKVTLDTQPLIEDEYSVEMSERKRDN